MEEKKQHDIESLLKRIESLEKDIEEYKTAGIDMGNEIRSLQIKIGGYRTSNNNYRKQVTELKERLDKTERLLKEADELYESKIHDKEHSDSVVEEKEKVIDGLTSQVAELRDTISDKISKIKEIARENEDLIKALEYEQLPWWKKLI